MEEFAKFDATSQPSDGTNLWRALRRHWIPAIAIATTVFAGVALYTLTRTPKYQSETLILIANKTAVPVVASEEGAPAGSSSTEQMSADISTDIQILQSHALVTRSLKNLDPAYRDLSAQTVVENLSISQSEDANVLVVSYTDTDPARIKAVLEALGLTYVNYSQESRRSQATNAIRFIEQKLPEARQKLNRSTSEIASFRRAHGIVNPDAYAESASEVRRNLQQQAKAAEITLNQTKRQYQQLQRQITQAGQTPETTLADSVLSQDDTYQKLVNQLREIEAQYALEKTRFREDFPGIQNLKERRDKARQLLESQVQRALGGRPSIAAAKTSVAGDTQRNLANQLLQIQMNLAGQTTQLNKIRQAEGQAAKDFQQVPRLQQEFTELQRQYKLNSETVDQLLARLQELRIVEAQETSPWKILEPAYLPSQPVSPDVERNLALGLVCGVLLGIGTAFLLDRSNQRIKQIDEVRNLTWSPLLGVVPKVDEKTLSPSNGGQLFQRSNAFTESIRSLALVLPFMNLEQGGGQLFALTSALPGEGKTTITYNLGLALSELGYRVLIVDADMHKPAIHRVAQLPNMRGLSTAISTNCPWQKLIQSSHSKHLNVASHSSETSPVALLQMSYESSTVGKSDYQLVLQPPDVMTSGPLPPNPIAWLASSKMTELFDQWRQAYDYVLVDTPPIAGIADALSIATQVDKVILVVGVECSTRSALTRAVEILQGTQCKIAGLVVNFLGREHGGYYYQRHYASYYNQPKSNVENIDFSQPGKQYYSGVQRILDTLLHRR